MKTSKMKFYESPHVTADTVIFTMAEDELKILLVKRENLPFKDSWALPGVFLLKNESAERAAKRALREKTNVKVSYLEQLYTFDSPLRDPRGHVISIAYFALISREKLSIKNSGVRAMFFSINKLPQLAFDHKTMVQYAVSRLRTKLEYTNVVYSLLPKHFTLGELQALYEIILKRRLDKRNFRKKFLSLKLVKQTRKYLQSGRQRPAALYEFISRKPQELKKFF